MRLRIRFAGGVAALAAMAVLAGCGGAAGTTATKDYLTPLVGTWMADSIRGTATIPAAGETPEQEIQVTRTVTVIVAKGTGSNMGTFSLTITTTALASPPPPPYPTIKVTGNVQVSASDAAVTITDVDPKEALPAGLSQALTAPYELMGNELKLSGLALVALGATKTAAEKLTLTKQAAS